MIRAALRPPRPRGYAAGPAALAAALTITVALTVTVAVAFTVAVAVAAKSCKILGGFASVRATSRGGASVPPAPRSVCCGEGPVLLYWFQVMRMDREKTGALIAAARKEKNMTQRDLAAALHVSDSKRGSPD